MSSARELNKQIYPVKWFCSDNKGNFPCKNLFCAAEEALFKVGDKPFLTPPLK